MNPRYPHWCNNCLFLGQHNEFDLYYCEEHKLHQAIYSEGNNKPHIIMRNGDTGNHIWSFQRNIWNKANDLKSPMKEAAQEAIKIASREGLICKVVAETVLAGVAI